MLNLTQNFLLCIFSSVEERFVETNYSNSDRLNPHEPNYREMFDEILRFGNEMPNTSEAVKYLLQFMWDRPSVINFVRDFRSFCYSWQERTEYLNYCIIVSFIAAARRNKMRKSLFDYIYDFIFMSYFIILFTKSHPIIQY